MRRHQRLGQITLAVGCCAVAMLFAGLTGCSTTSAPQQKKADPILGEVHPTGTPAYAPVPPDKDKDKTKTSSTGANTNATAQLDTPLSPSPTSNAYLASLTKPLPGSQPLAISDGQAPGPFQLTANSQPVVRPVPSDPAFVNNTWVTQPTGNPSGPGPFAAPPSNFVDPHIALLQSRGIINHRVDPLPDGTIRLTAVAPQRNNPSQQRTYEVVARDFPAAVQALIQQMDQGK